MRSALQIFLAWRDDGNTEEVRACVLNEMFSSFKVSLLFLSNSTRYVRFGGAIEIEIIVSSIHSFN